MKQQIDSLQVLLSSLPKDTTRVNTLIQYAILCNRVSDSVSSINSVQEALNLSSSLNYPLGVARAYGVLSRINIRKNNVAQAVRYIADALSIADREKSDVDIVMLAQVAIGIYNNYLTDRLTAMQLAQRALIAAERTKQPLLIVEAHTAIGSIHNDRGQAELALQSFKRGLVIALQGNLPTRLLYLNAGNAYTQLKQYDSAYYYLAKAEVAYRAPDLINGSGYAHVLHSLGNLHIELQQYTTALDYCMRAYDAYSRIGNRSGICNVTPDIAKIYRLIGEPKRAVEFALRMLPMAQAVGYLYGLEKIYSELSDSYARIGKYQEAYQYTILHRNLRDSIRLAESEKQILQYQIEYNTLEMKKENSQLLAQVQQQQENANEQTYRLIVAVSGLLFMMGLGFYLHRRYRAEQHLSRLLTDKNRELDEQKNLFNVVLDTAPATITMITKNETIRVANKRFAALINTTPEEVVGKHFADIVQPETYSVVRPLILRALRGETVSEIIDEMDLEEFVRMPREKKVFLIVFSPMVGHDGNIIGCVNVGLDVTAQRRAEEALRTKTAELQKQHIVVDAILEAAPIAITYMNRDNVYEIANSFFARITRKERHEVQGKKREEILSPAAYRAIDVFVQRAFQGELLQVFLDEEFWQRAEMYHVQDRNLLAVYAPVFNAEREIIGVLGVGIDVTDRSRAEREVWRVNQELIHANSSIAQQIEELEASSRAIATANAMLLDRNAALHKLNNEKSEFLGIVAHDLKNPLAGLILTAETLKAKTDADRATAIEISTKLSQIIMTAERMEIIIANLLNAETVESGAANLEQSSVNATQIFTEVAHEYAERAKEKRILISLEGTDTQVHILAHPLLLRQVYDNLVSNALKFSPEHGHITMRQQSFTNTVQFSIEDSGPGISKEDQQKLFTRFARLSVQPTAGESSTGLGLSVVKKFVSLMNGIIYCISDTGQNTQFVVEFPLLQ